MNKTNTVVPSATFTEKPDAYELKAFVPGIGKEDAELHIEGKTLTFKTHASWQAPAGFKEVSSEFARVNYAMSADLPEMADPSALTAKIENGILTVTIGKRPETQPKRIEIA